MRYRDILEAIDLPTSRHPATYWHGTDNISGRAILINGLRNGGEIVKKRDHQYIPPATEGVYLTPDFRYALQFSREHRQKYGWIFAVLGSDLAQVEVDEDEVGLALRFALRQREGLRSSAYDLQKHATARLVSRQPEAADELLALMRHLPDDIIQNLRTYNLHNAKWFADTGRILRPLMSERLTLAMASEGCHLVSLGGVAPWAAWRFPRAIATELHNASLRAAPEAALANLAERMR